MGWPCAVVWGVHGCLGGLVGGPKLSTIYWEGSPYVLYGAWVGLFCTFWTPKIYVVFLGASIGALIVFDTTPRVLVSATICYTPYTSLLFSICSALDG